MTINIHAAWIGFLCGCLAGAIPGLFFHRQDWLGGYASWPRRMIRLAHIAFFGLGLLNLAFALTARTLGMEAGLQLPSLLLIVGAVTMPIVCYMSIWRITCRHLFCIPVVAVASSIVLFLWRIVFP
jgi:hypothetical protein